ncbi:hypothetical protein OAE97_01075 [Verrucomicrobia bacterium]|nr:hypothetical protein [Verrucomicrobiota bacterium]MDB4664921.1 hypothetical protein [Verrucomicrobiota bacterium]
MNVIGILSLSLLDPAMLHENNEQRERGRYHSTQDVSKKLPKSSIADPRYTEAS